MAGGIILLVILIQVLGNLGTLSKGLARSSSSLPKHSTSLPISFIGGHGQRIKCHSLVFLVLGCGLWANITCVLSSLMHYCVCRVKFKGKMGICHSHSSIIILINVKLVSELQNICFATRSAV